MYIVSYVYTNVCAVVTLYPTQFKRSLLKTIKNSKYINKYRKITVAKYILRNKNIVGVNRFVKDA